MITRDVATRRIAARILLVQAAMTIAITVLCALAWGRIAALSALVGGGTGLIANAIMTLLVLNAAPHAVSALGRLVMGQAVKFMFTVSMLFFVAICGWEHWPALPAYY